MRRRFLLVHNPVAGVRGRRLVREVVEALCARGAVVEQAPPGHPNKDLFEGSGSAAYDAILAAGGDGTVRALAAALPANAPPLGIIPVGTGNVLAHEIGLPRRAARLADVLLDGPALDLEGAEANGAPFFLMAGVGFDGAVVRRLNVALKRRVGKLAYGPPVLATLAAREPELDITVDGERHTAPWLVVTRATHYGGSFVLTRSADLRRPGLTAVLFKDRGAVARVRALLTVVSGRLDTASGVSIIPCKKVSVASPVPVDIQLDGDPYGSSPVSISGHGLTLRLIVPAAYAAGTSR